MEKLVIDEAVVVGEEISETISHRPPRETRRIARWKGSTRLLDRAYRRDPLRGQVPSAAGALKLVAVESTLDGAILDVDLGTVNDSLPADALAERGVSFVFSTGHDETARPARKADIDLEVLPPRERSTTREDRLGGRACPPLHQPLLWCSGC